MLQRRAGAGWGGLHPRTARELHGGARGAAPYAGYAGVGACSPPPPAGGIWVPVPVGPHSPAGAAPAPAPPPPPRARSGPRAPGRDRAGGGGGGGHALSCRAASLLVTAPGSGYRSQRLPLFIGRTAAAPSAGRGVICIFKAAAAPPNIHTAGGDTHTDAMRGGPRAARTGTPAAGLPPFPRLPPPGAANGATAPTLHPPPQSRVRPPTATTTPPHTPGAGPRCNRRRRCHPVPRTPLSSCPGSG